MQRYFGVQLRVVVQMIHFLAFIMAPSKQLIIRIFRITLCVSCVLCWLRHLLASLLRRLRLVLLHFCWLEVLEIVHGVNVEIFDNAIIHIGHQRMLTLPLLMPLCSPTMWVSTYGRTGSFRFGFLAWAILNRVFHLSSSFVLSFFKFFGSWMRAKLLLVSFF